MLENKQLWRVFLFEFKIGLKAVETACNINNTFVPGTTNEHTVQCCFKKFGRDESLEDEECGGEPPEVDNDQLKTIMEADPLTATREVVEEFSIGLSIAVWHLKQIGKAKSLVSGCLMRWLKKKIVFKRPLILRNKDGLFLYQIVTWDKMWIWYDNWWQPAQWSDWEIPKHFP